MTRRIAVSLALGALLAYGMTAAGKVGAFEVVSLSEAETEARSALHSPDPTALGFDLGERLTVPDCDDWHGTFEDAPTCYDRSPGSILISAKEKPGFMKSRMARASIDDDMRLNQLSIMVPAAEVETVYLLLTKKYGPSDYKIDVLADFPMWKWTFADMDVELLGIDTGIVTFRTAKARREFEKGMEDSRIESRKAEAARRNL